MYPKIQPTLLLDVTDIIEDCECDTSDSQVVLIVQLILYFLFYLQPPDNVLFVGN